MKLQFNGEIRYFEVLMGILTILKNLVDILEINP